MGLLAWVLWGYTGIPGFQAIQTTLGHPCQLSGDNLHPTESTSGIEGDVSSNVMFQQTPSWKGKFLGHLGIKGEMICFASL